MDSLQQLRRWIDLDRELYLRGNGLHVDSFAEKWNVATRTVHRDLDTFRELGQVIWSEAAKEFSGHDSGGKKIYRHWYHFHTDQLFVCNLDLPTVEPIPARVVAHCSKYTIVEDDS